MKSKLPGKILALFLALLLTATLLYGCGSMARESGGADMIADEGTTLASADYSYGFAEEGKAAYTDGEGSGGEEIAYAPTSGPDTNLISSQTASRVILRNATITAEAEDMDAFYQELLNYVKSVGGYEFNHSNSKSDDDKYSSIKVTFKAPPEKLEAILAFADDHALVKSSDISSSDITAEYYDTATRLQSKRNSLEQYYKLLEKTASVKDIVEVQSHIDQLTEEIESLEGQLKMWDSLAQESTIEVIISQKAQIVKDKDQTWDTYSFDEMLKAAKDGLISVTNTIVVGLQWFAIILVSAAPVWVPLGIILLIFLLAIRRRNKKRARLAEQIAADSGDDAPDAAPIAAEAPAIPAPEEVPAEAPSPAQSPDGEDPDDSGKDA